MTKVCGVCCNLKIITLLLRGHREDYRKKVQRIFRNMKMICTPLTLFLFDLGIQIFSLIIRANAQATAKSLHN